jgi:hypothetical protein
MTTWYYDHFERLFSRGTAEYDVEAAAINEMVKVSGKRAQEIGAGTGNHVASMLKYEPESVLAIDREPVACEILRNRFASEPRVDVLCGDGFAAERPTATDLTYCMYSVMLQGLNSRAALTARIRTLLACSSIVVFEGIDVGVNLRIFPEGDQNRTYENGKEFLDVAPSYLGGKLMLTFTGRLGGDCIAHNVSLLALSRTETTRLAEAAGCVVQARPLDKDYRRVLYFCARE